MKKTLCVEFIIKTFLGDRKLLALNRAGLELKISIDLLCQRAGSGTRSFNSRVYKMAIVTMNTLIMTHIKIFF